MDEEICDSVVEKQESENVQLSILLPVEVNKKLRDRAALEDRKISAVIKRAVELYLES